MQKVVLFLSIALQLVIGVNQALAHGAAKSQHGDVRTHRGCSYCGMDRGQYSHSRMQLTYMDNSVTGLCSVRCLVIELKAHKNKKVRLIEVADYHAKTLINAETAYWVVGGRIKGVMTKTPKWAFADKSAAEMFISKHGGILSSYEKVISMTIKER
jgi:copper chaperone NosL